MKKMKILIIIVCCVLIAVGLTVGLTMYFSKTESKIKYHKGNNEKYSVSRSLIDDSSPLKDKKYIFLGSSVTIGATSNNESFVDYLQKIDGIEVVKKEAVSGTTLVDNGEKSYISRLKTIDKDVEADYFVCQLSTNDASLKLPLGNISDSLSIEEFDTSTIAGAIEYIITYAKATFDCKVVFYTGTKYNSEEYQNMVDLLYQIKEKHNIGIIDLWNDEEMNSVSEKDYQLYMFDGIHPTRAGYKLWWTPKFEEYFRNN